MYYTDNKFCVARLRGNYTHIIKPFDTLNEAVAYAESLLDEWDYFGGLPCVTVRHTRQNPDEWRKMGLKPYTDNIVWCQFDMEKVEEADRITENYRRNQKNKRYKKRRKNRLLQNAKEDNNGDMERNTGI